MEPLPPCCCPRPVPVLPKPFLSPFSTEILPKAQPSKAKQPLCQQVSSLGCSHRSGAESELGEAAGLGCWGLVGATGVARSRDWKLNPQKMAKWKEVSYL